jgi:hypothetical protein
MLNLQVWCQSSPKPSWLCLFFCLGSFAIGGQNSYEWTGRRQQEETRPGDGFFDLLLK